MQLLRLVYTWTFSILLDKFQTILHWMHNKSLDENHVRITCNIKIYTHTSDNIILSFNAKDSPCFNFIRFLSRDFRAYLKEIIYDALLHSEPFVQFQKREKHQRTLPHVFFLHIFQIVQMIPIEQSITNVTMNHQHKNKRDYPVY